MITKKNQPINDRTWRSKVTKLHWDALDLVATTVWGTNIIKPVTPTQSVFSYVEWTIPPSQFLKRLSQDFSIANDVKELLSPKVLTPDARSWYLFSYFLWDLDDIPAKFNRDEKWVVRFCFGDKKGLFLPMKDRKIVYEELMLEIRREIWWEFSREKLKNIGFSDLQDNGMAIVRFLYDQKPLSFPFLVDDPFVLQSHIDDNTALIMDNISTHQKDQAIKKRRERFAVVKDRK